MRMPRGTRIDSDPRIFMHHPEGSNGLRRHSRGLCKESMRDLEYELLRKNLPRTSVNKGKDWCSFTSPCMIDRILLGGPRVL
jgi:hypothetical protein